MVTWGVDWWWLLYPAITIILLLTLTVFARRTGGRGRRVAIVTSVVVTVVYLVWRALFTLPTESPVSLIVGIVLLVTEALGAFQTFLVSLALWRPVKPKDVPLPAHGPYPSVDIFIATYNEPASMLIPTLAAAASIRYPGVVQVYLCDDGRRPELTALAARFGAVHVTRPDNSHAKAGNLNHALAHSSGELVVTLDADMVPRENLLEVTVGHFMADPNLGLAQAPQTFYNEDPFQYNLFSGKRLPNEQDFFMRELQGGYARFNSTMYVGSNAVFRRSALDAVGGFATGGLTEDFATGIQLQRQKFRIAYVPDIVAAGLAAEDVADLLQQRDRWCRGAIQCAKEWNPFTVSGLTFVQRLIYANRILYWYFGAFKAVYLYTPVLFLLFGITALDTSVWELLMFWLPYYLASFTAFRILSGGRRSFTWSHIYELAMGPAILVSAVAETIGLSNTRFAVTPKGVTKDHRVMYWRLALPHFVFLVLSVLGLMNTYWWNAGVVPLEHSIIPAAWTTYNIVGTAMSILVFVQRPRFRGVERTAVAISTTVRPVDHRREPVVALIDDVSITGARVRVPHAVADGRLGERVELSLPDQDAGENPAVTVRADVVWAVNASETDDSLLGLRFVEPSPDAEIRLMQYITRAPNWVRHEFEDRSYVAGVSRDAVRGLAATPSRQNRREVRVFPDQRLAVEFDVPGVPEPYAGDIVDISASGMQVRLGDRRALVDVGAHVLTRTTAGGPQHGEQIQAAEVIWVKRTSQATLVGLRFARLDDVHLTEGEGARRRGKRELEKPSAEASADAR